MTEAQKIELAYRTGWNDARRYYNPEVGPWRGPETPDEGWREYRETHDVEATRTD